LFFVFGIEQDLDVLAFQGGLPSSELVCELEIKQTLACVCASSAK
jgi:hypothetical protein